MYGDTPPPGSAGNRVSDYIGPARELIRKLIAAFQQDAELQGTERVRIRVSCVEIEEARRGWKVHVLIRNEGVWNSVAVRSQAHWHPLHSAAWKSWKIVAGGGKALVCDASRSSASCRSRAARASRRSRRARASRKPRGSRKACTPRESSGTRAQDPKVPKGQYCQWFLCVP